MLRDADRIVIALLILLIVIVLVGFDTVFRLASPRFVVWSGGAPGGGGEEVPAAGDTEAEPDDRQFGLDLGTAESNVRPLRPAAEAT